MLVVLIDQIDAGALNSEPHLPDRGELGVGFAALECFDGGRRYARFLGKIGS